MPYVDRDQAGNIIGIYANAQREGHEFVETAECWIAPPKIVTMRQARLALLQAGLLDNVNQAVNAMQGIQGDSARIEWDFSSEVYRDKALVKSLAPVLGMTEESLDQLFIAASKL